MIRIDLKFYSFVGFGFIGEFDYNMSDVKGRL